MPSTRIVRALPLLLALCCAACRGDNGVYSSEEGLVLGREEVQQVVERSIVPEGRTLVLNGFSGAVTVRAGASPQARLVFTKRARGDSRADAAGRLEGVSVGERGDNRFYFFEMSSDLPAHTGVDVDAEVPPGTPLRIELENGEIVVHGVRGPIEIESLNGSVEVYEAAADVTVRSRNGDVTAALAALTADGRVQLRTDNGRVTLGLPRGLSAVIEAETEAGNVYADEVPFARQSLARTVSGARFTATVGQGEARIEARTTNGDVVIRPAEGLLPEFLRPAPALPDTASAAPDTAASDSTAGTIEI